jgi:protein TonB
MQTTISRPAAVFALLCILATAALAQTDSPPAPTTVEAWKRSISIQLESKRVFPPEATGQSGTAKVKFVIDRQGKVISRELVQSAGSAVLDAAALRIIERSEPFPRPPDELTDDHFTFVAPIAFAKRRELPWAGGQWSAGWAEEQKKVDEKIHGICRGC